MRCSSIPRNSLSRGGIRRYLYSRLGGRYFILLCENILTRGCLSRYSCLLDNNPSCILAKKPWLNPHSIPSRVANLFIFVLSLFAIIKSENTFPSITSGTRIVIIIHLVVFQVPFNAHFTSSSMPGILTVALLGYVEMLNCPCAGEDREQAAPKNVEFAASIGGGDEVRP